MLYIIACYDKPGVLPLRQQHRAAHLAYWQNFAKAVRFGGPFLDEKGAMCGSMLALEAETYAEARQAAENDPYNKAGIFTAIEVRAWQWALNAPEG